VPSGSGNDLARQLGIPRDDIEAAVAALVDAQVVEVDLGRAHTADGATTWFTTVANAGFDAEANRWSNSVGWASGAPLYVLAALRTLAHYRPRPFRITVDDETFDTEAWLVAIGNTRSYASGMMITPAADLYDGLLDVCVVGPVDRLGFLRAFPSVFRGGHVEHPMVEVRQGATVTVESPGATTTPELWAGGEHAGPLPAWVEAVPAAVRVAVPRSPG
jgi:diacylglycerol kinase (ATP)